MCRTRLMHCWPKKMSSRVNSPSGTLLDGLYYKCLNMLSLECRCTYYPGHDACSSPLHSQKGWVSFAAEYTEANSGKLNCLSFTCEPLVRHLNHLATEYFPCIVLGIMQSHSSDMVLLIIQSSCILPLGNYVQLKTKWLLVVV